jgi:hypothetical protein
VRYESDSSVGCALFGLYRNVLTRSATVASASELLPAYETVPMRVDVDCSVLGPSETLHPFGWLIDVDESTSAHEFILGRKVQRLISDILDTLTTKSAPTLLLYDNGASSSHLTQTHQQALINLGPTSW